MEISFVLNGRPATVRADPATNLIDVLRNELGLTGTKQGCDYEGECGACTVLLDGRPIRSCLTPLGKVAGRCVLTIEGLDGPDGLHPLQSAFIETGAVQCGYCTPGLILVAKALLDREPDPTREQVIEAPDGNLCRCTGYTRIVAAVELAAARMQGKGGAAITENQVTSPFIGGSVLRADAVDKVTGRAKYVEDIHMPGLLHARVLRSPYHHARLLSLNTAPAAHVPGMIRVVTAADVPGTNGFAEYSRDEPVLPAVGSERLRLNPTLLLHSEPSTPLQHSETATGKLLYMAEHALPIVHSPAPMMGGTAPVTLAGGLALGNAEVLSSLVMHQLKRPGAPFVYGQGLHHMDMKTTISVYGAPEFQLARVLVADMGRFYGLPTWGYAGHSDSCVMDEQAAADATFSVLTALMSGTNLVHDVGYLEAGLTTSPEMIVFTAEAISMVRRFAAGVSLDAESLALDAIHNVGPGGDFLTHKHTLSHFRKLWQPALFTKQRADDWVAAGSKRLGERLCERTVALIDEHKSEPLPDGAREEIAYILRQSPASRD